MIRYHKLGYVELNVSDLDRACTFYQQMVGLQRVGTPTANSASFRCDQDPYSVVLHRSGQPGFKRAGWILEDASQFEVLHRRLSAHGVTFEVLSKSECDQRGLGQATRIVEPNTRATLEFYLPPVQQPTCSFEPAHTKIQRLGHVVFATPRRAQAVAFFRDVLNFRESDSLGEAISFLRPFPNPFHHGIGIGHSDSVHFNHLNFMVTEVDDIGRGLHRMRRGNVPIVYGPGRHPASGSMFLYFLEPDGMTLEYSFGMEEFAEVDPRSARVLPPSPENFDSWGSPRDVRMGTGGAIESAVIAVSK